MEDKDEVKMKDIMEGIDAVAEEEVSEDDVEDTLIDEGKVYIIDIETTGLKAFDVIKKRDSKGVEQRTMIENEVTAIGLYDANLNKEHILVRKDKSAEDEKRLLMDFVNVLKEGVKDYKKVMLELSDNDREYVKSPDGILIELNECLIAFVGFNNISFDMPFLKLRMLKHNIDLWEILNEELGETKVVDDNKGEFKELNKEEDIVLQEPPVIFMNITDLRLLLNPDKYGRGRLGEYCEWLGFKDADPTKGSDMVKMWAECDFEGIGKHLEYDIQKTVFLFEKLHPSVQRIGVEYITNWGL